MKSSLNQLTKPLIRPFTEFFATESSSGIILLGVSVLALVLANSEVGIAQYFPAIWDSKLSVSVNNFRLEKTLAHWVNDGLMALFFLVVGLEIKREIIEGELSSPDRPFCRCWALLGG